MLARTPDHEDEERQRADDNQRDGMVSDALNVRELDREV